MKLIDDHGRKIRKLRLSLTDKCNLRCHYCMPLTQTFMDESKYLAPDEYQEIVKELVDLGLEEIRLTGGEPLMRKSFSTILESIADLRLKKISLTTNGILLDQYWDLLKRCKVWNLNVSLDSLDQVNFKRITHGDYLPRILSNILSAKKLGFIVKINVVVMKGINDHEIMDFVKFAEDHQIEVRFLELMRIGHACSDQKDQFISAKAIMKRIQWHHELRPITMPDDSTSFNFVTDKGANLGFIASESQPFCGMCSRWRLSADGILRACLMKDDGISIKKLNNLERLEKYQIVLGMKPAMRPSEVFHSMNSIGG